MRKTFQTVYFVKHSEHNLHVQAYIARTYFSAVCDPESCNVMDGGVQTHDFPDHFNATCFPFKLTSACTKSGALADAGIRATQTVFNNKDALSTQQ